MPISRAYIPVLLAFCGTIATVSDTASAALIYREIFPNPSGANQDLNADGWQIHFDNGAKVDDTGATGVDNTNSPTFNAPADNTLPGVNSAPSDGPPVNGYAFARGTGPTADYIFWTNEYTVDRSAQSVTSIGWWQANELSTATSRAAVQIGSQWYASTQTFTDTSGNSIGNAEQKTLDFTTATWQSLDFVPGSSLALGGATVLPSGNFDAFGWYVDTNGGSNRRLRLDTFEINAEAIVVPEPATGLLLALVLRHSWNDG